MTERYQRQTDCDHTGEPPVMSLAEYLKRHPAEADRMKALEARSDDCIPMGLKQLLYRGGK